jgi:hypothetical protein
MNAKAFLLFLFDQPKKESSSPLRRKDFLGVFRCLANPESLLLHLQVKPFGHPPGQLL